MKPAFLVELKTSQDYMRRTFVVALIMTVLEICALQMIGPIPGIMGSIVLVGCARSGLNNSKQGWSEAQLVMPLSRKDVVLARYKVSLLVGFLAMLLGFVICAAVGALASYMDVPDMDLSNLVLSTENLQVVALSSAILMMIGFIVLAFLFPMAARYGDTGAVELLPFIIWIVFLIPTVVMMSWEQIDNPALNAVMKVMTEDFASLGNRPWDVALISGVVFALGLLILAISSRVAVKWYEEKDL